MPTVCIKIAGCLGRQASDDLAGQRDFTGGEEGRTGGGRVAHQPREAELRVAGSRGDGVFDHLVRGFLHGTRDGLARLLPESSAGVVILPAWQRIEVFRFKHAGEAHHWSSAAFW